MTCISISNAFFPPLLCSIWYIACSPTEISSIFPFTGRLSLLFRGGGGGRVFIQTFSSSWYLRSSLLPTVLLSTGSVIRIASIFSPVLKKTSPTCCWQDSLVTLLMRSWEKDGDRNCSSSYCLAHQRQTDRFPSGFSFIRICLKPGKEEKSPKA